MNDVATRPESQDVALPIEAQITLDVLHVFGHRKRFEQRLGACRIVPGGIEFHHPLQHAVQIVSELHLLVIGAL